LTGLKLLNCGKPHKTQDDLLVDVNLFCYPQSDSEHEYVLTEKFIIAAGSSTAFIWTECVSCSSVSLLSDSSHNSYQSYLKHNCDYTLTVNTSVTLESQLWGFCL